MGYLRFKFKKNKKIKFVYKNINFPNSVSRISSLVLTKPLLGGRNNTGVCVFRNRGGGVKKFYRILDFFHVLWEIPAFVLRKEYDPYRTGFINLVCYINGMLSYYLGTEGLKRRNVLRTTNFFLEFTKGYTMKLKNIPEGSILNSVEIRKNSGGNLARAAGTFCILLKKFSSQKILVRLPSKEEIFLKENCIATIGRVSNINHKLIYGYKAGQSRWKNKRPLVRGVARNPVDHPHGGGGGKHLVTLWGRIAKNKPTRKKNKFHQNLVVLSRKKKKKKSKK
jgi:large subunit ribosomal protein L2